MYHWHPTHCTLQLNFVQANASNEDRPSVLRTGDSYSGTSLIRYVRRQVPLALLAEDTPAMPLGGEAALHFHAITAHTHATPRATPLVLHSIKVQQPQEKTGFLNVVKVVEEEKGGECNEDGVSGSSYNGGQRNGAVKNCNQHRGKEKRENGGAKNAQRSACRGSDGTMQHADPGSKRVFFEGGSSMPLGSTVILVINFTGRIQAWDQGGIYTNDKSQVLLTHFEVSLARLAFPCPDDPRHYRLMWHLQSLQLPSNYAMVVSNTLEVSRKVRGGKGTQYAFSPVGPLPAYVFAFAAFTGSVAVLEKNVELRGLSHYATAGECSQCLYCENNMERCDSGEKRVVPLRVITAATSGVTVDTLAQIANTVRKATRLLEDFFASPLPLQQSPFAYSVYPHEQQEALTVAVVPTMPYISGMEHHGCIFLNEAVYRSSVGGGNAKGAHKQRLAGAKGTEEVNRVELIVHELSHHWVGNTIGMPFALKEGVCLVLEQCLGDVILGKPMRKIKASGDATAFTALSSQGTTTTTTTTTAATASGISNRASTTGVVVVVDAEKGKELTGHSYQKALNTLRDVVSKIGFAAFKEGMQRMYKLEVVNGGGGKATPSDAVGNNDGNDNYHDYYHDDNDAVGACWDACAPSSCYISADQFMAYMKAQSPTEQVQ